MKNEKSSPEKDELQSTDQPAGQQVNGEATEIETSPAAPILEIKGTEKKFLRYDFKAVEKDQLSDLLANKVQEKESIEMSKKSANAVYKSQIDTVSQEINELATKVSNNYEYRDVACEVIYNQPRRGMKTYIRSDTGTVFTEEMNDSDYAFVAKKREPVQTSIFNEDEE